MGMNLNCLGDVARAIINMSGGHMFSKSMRVFALALMAVALLVPVAKAQTSEAWSALRPELYGTREISDGLQILTLEAPTRAEDAALVPITLRVAAAGSVGIKSVALVVDENPAPLVATFTYGPAAGAGERVLSTRIRVDSYSNVRAIAEDHDGRLYMVTRFVKAAGGCSAPAGKDPDAALRNLGRMQVRHLPGTGGTAMREAQLMIRHPNSSGFQMDQLTGLYIPAKYVQKIEVRRGADLVLTMEGGISISEDPNVRFSYDGPASATLDIRAEDTDGKVFVGRSTGAPNI
jgi:sulfur-oxidizing protein SoxY